MYLLPFGDLQWANVGLARVLREHANAGGFEQRFSCLRFIRSGCVTVLQDEEAQRFWDFDQAIKGVQKEQQRPACLQMKDCMFFIDLRLELHHPIFNQENYFPRTMKGRKSIWHPFGCGGLQKQLFLSRGVKLSSRISKIVESVGNILINIEMINQVHIIMWAQ